LATAQYTLATRHFLLPACGLRYVITKPHAGWIAKYILYFALRAALCASKFAPGKFVEPTNARIKTWCLTTWRRPNKSVLLNQPELLV